MLRSYTVCCVQCYRAVIIWNKGRKSLQIKAILSKNKEHLARPTQHKNRNGTCTLKHFELHASVTEVRIRGRIDGSNQLRCSSDCNFFEITARENPSAYLNYFSDRDWEDGFEAPLPRFPNHESPSHWGKHIAAVALLKTSRTDCVSLPLQLNRNRLRFCLIRFLLVCWLYEGM